MISVLGTSTLNFQDFVLKYHIPLFHLYSLSLVSYFHLHRDALSSGIVVHHYSSQEINSGSIANIDNKNSTIEVLAFLVPPIFDLFFLM